jgi:hypothetical protein
MIRAPADSRRATIGHLFAEVTVRHRIWVAECASGESSPLVTPSARIAISDFAAGTGSFADDLYKERGIVRGRVDLFLRSSEIKPLFS